MIEKVIEGKFLIDGNVVHCCIGIRDGRIVEIKKSLEGENKIKLRKGLILPAAIDVHVHLREPGFVDKEDFATGTLSAAFGGVSCILDMPNTRPPTVDRESCKDKLSIGRRKAYVDFGIYLGVNKNNLKKLEEFEELVVGYKVYLSGAFGIRAFDVELLSELAQSRIRRVVAFHAEDLECLQKHHGKEENLIDHARVRPSTCERIAIEKILQKMGRSELRLHICHVSSSSSLYVLSSKERNLSIGVTPHHLIFKASKELKPQSYYKVNPPIRTSIDQEALWEGLLSGEINLIESDHAPHTIDEKETEFPEAPSGMPGVETMYPVMLYIFTRKGYPLERLVSVLCKNPASIFGLNKGEIKKGKDADLAVFDFKNVKKIRADDLHYKCGWTAFEGMKGIFPTDLFVRGERIIEDGELIGDRGFGEPTKPKWR